MFPIPTRESSEDNQPSLDKKESFTLNSDLESQTSNKDNTQDATLKEDNIDDATLNEDNIDDATSNKDNIDATSNEDNIDATLNEDNIENATLNEDNIDATLNEDNIEDATLNEDNIDATLNEDNIDATSNEDNIDATSNEDNLQVANNNEENIKNAAFNEEAHIKEHEEHSESGHLIKIPDLLSKTKMSKVYEVNGSRFVDEDTLSSHDDDTLVNYELYKVVKATGPEDNGEDEDMTTELDIHVQFLQQGGVIINSNVYLWDAQWHTMALIDGKVFRCAICQVYCDRTNCADHVETISHLRNMTKYKPLKRFDLSIVRKINGNLHCGVCNDIIDVIDYKTHENSKSHEGNLLTAINKVSDIMYDSNIHRIATTERKFHISDRSAQSYDRSAQSHERSAQSHDRSPQSHERSAQSHERSAQSHNRSAQSHDRNSVSDRNALTPDTEARNNNSDFHFDANAINSFHVYEEFSESDEEFAYEGEEYTTPHQGISYASMASKRAMELPKFLKIDLGTKEVRVKFESWHMIIKIELNRFYCMVCNKQDHIRYKSQHCISCEHVEKLAMCTVVKAFEDYLIRKIDDKLYHCGHCNNLQYQNQISDHIESAHPKKNKNIIDAASNSPLKTTKKSAKIEKPTAKSIAEQKPKMETENTNKNVEFKIGPKIDIFGDLTFSPFGSEITIAALALNFIMKKDENYHCAVCDKLLADVKLHVEEIDHIELMYMTPFVRPFKNNLTRAVRGMLHCSLCNELISVHEILHHNIDTPHINALASALGLKKTQKPVKTTKTEYFGQNKNCTNTVAQELPSLTIGVPNPPPNIPPGLKPQSVQKEIESGVLKISTHDKSTGVQSDITSKEKTNIKIDSPQTDVPKVNFNVGSNYFGPKLPVPRQNVQNHGQNNQIPGLNLPVENPLNFPSIYNSPPISSFNSQNFKFLGAPLSYAPYFLYSPGRISPNTTQNLYNQPNNITNQNVKNSNSSKPAEKTGAKTEIESGKVNIESGKVNIESGKVNIESGKVNIESSKDNIESANDTIESVVSQSDDEDKALDEEQLVFIKLKTTYFKITYMSYNSLVYLDNGIRYCFVCSNTVRSKFLYKHVESREHAENVAKNKFLDKYGVQLFRQMYLMYHCAICNELMTRKEIKVHLDWPIHIEKYDVAYIKLNKKSRKELKSGIKEYVVGTQKEAIFHNVNEPKINVVSAYQIVPNLDDKKDTPERNPDKGSKAAVIKKNKMVIMNNVVMKVGFDLWHGITFSKNVTKCIICQIEIKKDQISEHVESDYHSVALGKPFEKTYYPALIRKINDNTVNCMICNLELPNNEPMIHEHIIGRKHNKNQENIANESSNSESYADCYEEYLTL